MVTTNVRTWGMLLVVAAVSTACEQTPVALPEATTLVITPAQLELIAGDIATAAAQVLDQNGRVLRDAEASWSSSAPSIGRVTPDGVVTAVAPGTAMVIATYGTLKAELPVTVVREDRDFLTALELSRTALAFDRRAGVQSVGYRAYDGRGRSRCDAPLELTVSDRSVVNVAQASSCRIMVTPIGPGQSTVTAANGAASASFAVTVTLGGEIAFFAERPEPADLTAGSTLTYRVRVLDADDQPIANHTVNFDVSIGTLASTSTKTDEHGYATVAWRLPRQLRVRTSFGDFDSGGIVFRTQLSGYVQSDIDAHQIVAGPAASVAFQVGTYTSAGLTVQNVSGSVRMPLNATAVILAETFDDYSNRRDISQLRFAVDGQPSLFTQILWLGTRHGRGIMSYESVPRTVLVTVLDGEFTADLTVEFTNIGF